MPQSVEDKAAYLREWRKRNPDYESKRRKENPEYYREKNRRWSANRSPEKKARDLANARERGKIYYRQKLKAMRAGFSQKVSLAMYGMNAEQFEELFIAQGKCCAICRQPHDSGRTGRRMNIDHCHANGHIRGLLCTSCNTKLGWYEKHRERIISHLSNSVAL